MLEAYPWHTRKSAKNAPERFPSFWAGAYPQGIPILCKPELVVVPLRWSPSVLRFVGILIAPYAGHVAACTYSAALVYCTPSEKHHLPHPPSKTPKKSMIRKWFKAYPRAYLGNAMVFCIYIYTAYPGAYLEGMNKRYNKQFRHNPIYEFIWFSACDN